MAEPTYYLQVVRKGEAPIWPESDEELIVGSQDIGQGLVQYWAYHKSSRVNASDLPPAEILAQKYSSKGYSILIDQDDNLLDLILVKDGHSFTHTISSEENLEDNINSLFDFAKEKFNIKVEGFMTTDKVSPKIESVLDDLTKDSDDQNDSEELDDSEQLGTKSDLVGTTQSSSESDEPENRNSDDSGIPSYSESSEPDDGDNLSFRNLASKTDYLSGGVGVAGQIRPLYPNGSHKTTWVLIVVLLLLLTGVGVYFKDTVIKKMGLGQIPTPSPTRIPSPTSIPTPTMPEVDRAKYKLRVLNGTTTTGAAKTLADKLKERGWQVIAFGNATASAFSKTQVRVKGAFEAILPVLVNDLLPELDASSAADLKEDNNADVEVIIGKE